MSDIQLLPYHPEMQEQWDRLVKQSRNGTFLLTRPFMDYHADRLTDCSLLFFKKRQPLAAFAGNYETATRTVHAHQGLTYGGFILAPQAYTEDVLHMQQLLQEYYRKHLNAGTLLVKPTPSAYHSLSTEEPLYALFRAGAQLVGRSLSAAVSLAAPPPLTNLRNRAIQRATKEGVLIHRTHSEDEMKQFHQLLSQCLEERHRVKPVHSANEMLLLSQRFPNNISLVVARHPHTHEMLAGTWLFHCKHLLHTQYLATTTLGRQLGALDMLLNSLIQQPPTGATLLDFGISTTQNGYSLNTGLAHYKEGFGARAICYDCYQLNL